jgi:hypothetical protein
MKTETITAERFAAAGVPLKDARWYFAQGRPNGFRAPGAAERATKILQKACAVKH